jgi:hypothetical protein
MRAKTATQTSATFPVFAPFAPFAPFARIPLLAAGAAALLFTACVNDDRSAGVDEFPNSIYARVNTFLDEGKKSEYIAEVSGGSDGLLGTPGFHVGAGKLALPKVSAALAAASADGSLHGLAKSASTRAGADSGCIAGPITITDTVKSQLKTTVNIGAICFDAKALDSIKGNETVLSGKSVTTYNTGRVESAEITDGDGDGILNPKGTGAKANIVFSALEKNILEKSVLLVGPGPDANFDTEADNVVYAASWTRTSGSDTLGYAKYADADSDGIAIDNGKPSVVDLEFYEKGATKDHPDAVWSKANLRMVVKYKVEAKEVRRVRFELETRAGRKEIGEILNQEGGRDIDMRERVHAHFYTIGAAQSDSLDTMYVHLSMTLGADFDDKADDSVYAIDVRTRKNSGDERLARFSFVSDKPIPSGKDPQEGALDLSVEYADGTTLTVEGDISPTRMDVTIKDREDKRLHVVWDRQGRGISLEKLK